MTPSPRGGLLAATVLLVEDELSVRLVLGTALADAGHCVAEAASLDEGLRLLETSRFHLVVADLALADGDGTALLDAAAALGMPAIGITGDTGRLLSMGDGEGSDPGTDDAPARRLLAKPFKTERLLAAVDALLGRDSRP